VFWSAGVFFKTDQTQLGQSAFESTFPEADFEKARSEIIAANQEVKVLKAFDATRFNLPAGLETITAAASSGIKIEDITIISAGSGNETSDIEISGKAATRLDIVNFDKAVRAIKGVKTVDSPLSNFDEPTNASFKLKIEIDLPHMDYNKKQ